MPITKSAKKALRRDKRRTSVNKVIKDKMKEAIKKALVKKGAATLKQAYSAVDKARKRKLIHRNKAARIKARLARGQR